MLPLFDSNLTIIPWLFQIDDKVMPYNRIMIWLILTNTFGHEIFFTRTNLNLTSHDSFCQLVNAVTRHHHSSLFLFHQRKILRISNFHPVWISDDLLLSSLWTEQNGWKYQKALKSSYCTWGECQDSWSNYPNLLHFYQFAISKMTIHSGTVTLAVG